MLKIEKSDNDKPRVGPARNCARKLLKTAGITEPPVLINTLIPTLDKDHELIIKSWSLSDNISGFLIQEEGLNAIAYNDSQHTHRQRFTVAHEFGHLLLGHNNTNCSKSLTSKDSKEIEANQFAAELLMPLEFLKKDFGKGGQDIPSMAKKYLVSVEAMGWRVQDPFVMKSLL